MPILGKKDKLLTKLTALDIYDWTCIMKNLRVEAVTRKGEDNKLHHFAHETNNLNCFRWNRIILRDRIYLIILSFAIYNHLNYRTRIKETRSAAFFFKAAFQRGEKLITTSRNFADGFDF